MLSRKLYDTFDCPDRTPFVCSFVRSDYTDAHSCTEQVQDRREERTTERIRFGINATRIPLSRWPVRIIWN